MSTMAEVLAAHQYDREKAVCTCSNEVQVGLRCDKQTHAEHVADELTKAGYGKLDEARAAELGYGIPYDPAPRASYPADDYECCASGSCEVCNPGAHRWNS